MEKIAQRLYRELFPVELRREYRRFAALGGEGNLKSVSESPTYTGMSVSEIPTYVGRTLQIVSDEPWIPWELIKPYDDEPGQELIDHDF